MIKEVKLPEIAENVEKATVVSIMVRQGDEVQEEQPLMEMESDKAAFEVPSTAAGIIQEIKVSEGDEIEIGSIIATIDTDGAGAGEKESAESDEQEKKQKDAPEEKSQEAEKTAEKTEQTQATPQPQQQPAQEVSKTSSNQEQQDAAKIPRPGIQVPASPTVRRFARELGVDVSQVKGTGPANRITQEDIKAFVKKNMERGASGAGINAPVVEMPDFSKWGDVEREKMSKVRKMTAEAMSLSWQTIPHVNHFDKADVTSLEDFRQKYAKKVEKAGGKLTVTAILLRVIAEALKAFPKMNASIDMKQEEIIYKKYINIGIAVDTDRGLLVPVIRNVEQKTITELSLELTEIAQKARDKKISPEDMQGGNFIISNLGGIGGTNFTPVIYPTNVGIMGISRTQTEPVYENGEWMPKLMLPLSLSYDHRIIDGAEGARFTRWVCDALENPISVFM